MANKESLYDEKRRNTKQYRLELRKTLDCDIIEKLESVENRAGYLKSLIRNDITNSCDVELSKNKITTTREKRLALDYLSDLIRKDIAQQQEKEKEK